MIAKNDKLTAADVEESGGTIAVSARGQTVRS
jgi:hypothetical protein